MRIARKYLAHYINAGTEDEPVYVRLGKDLEEFSNEMSAQVDFSRNILGENSVIISGYEKTAAVEPYYAEEGTPLFERLQTIIDEGQVLDDLKTQVIEVKMWDSRGADHLYGSMLEEAYLEITSYGGDTNGYRINFTIHYTGAKMPGCFNVADKTFMED